MEVPGRVIESTIHMCTVQAKKAKRRGRQKARQSGTRQGAVAAPPPSAWARQSAQHASAARVSARTPPVFPTRGGKLPRGIPPSQPAGVLPSPILRPGASPRTRRAAPPQPWGWHTPPAAAIPHARERAGGAGGLQGACAQGTDAKMPFGVPIRRRGAAHLAHGSAQRGAQMRTSTVRVLAVFVLMMIRPWAFLCSADTLQ
jgi:hypothetical protein